VNSGWIYALINPAHPHVLKIGMTEKEPKERVKELYGTGVLSPFALVHAERVSDASAAEAFIHQCFDARRVNPNREFFAVSADEAITTMKEAARRFSPTSATELAQAANDVHGAHAEPRKPVAPRDSAAIALAEAVISIEAAFRTFCEAANFPPEAFVGLSVDEYNTSSSDGAPSEKIIFPCPKCARRMRVPHSQNVIRVKCPQCSENMLVCMKVRIGKIYVRRFFNAGAVPLSLPGA
jgi:hypothetical protein